MKRVRLADVEGVSPPDEELPDGRLAASVGTVRQLTDRLGATDVAINHYELAPGESFTISPHAHPEQEEVFLVVDGEVTFETDDEPVVVGADEVLRVPPGTFQLGTNRAEEPATVFALGAPKEYASGGRWQFVCDDCETVTVHEPVTLDDREAYRCEVCGTLFE